MRKKAKLLSAVLALSLLFTACGSSDSGGKSDQGSKGLFGSSTEEQSSGVQPGSGTDPVEVDTQQPVSTLGLGDLQLSQPYEEWMLYGIYEAEYDNYGIHAEEYKADKTVIFNSVTNLSFKERILDPDKGADAKKSMVSTVPLRVEARHMTDYMMLIGYNLELEEDWQRIYQQMVEEFPDHADEYFVNFRNVYNTSYISMSFVYETGEDVNKKFYYTYTIENDVLHCKRFKGLNEDFTINYYEPEITEDFRFGFQGTSLLLEQNGCTSELEAFEIHNADNGWNVYGGIVSEDQAYNNLAEISIFNVAESNEDIFLQFTDGSFADNPKLVFTEPNRFSLSWEASTSENKVGTMAAKEGSIDFRFLCCSTGSDNGFVLIDDSGKAYYYLAKDVFFKKKGLENIKEEDQAKALSNQEKIVDQLQERLSSAGIHANIDSDTGKTSYDSSVLFAVDSADLSADGKASMDAFLDAYVPVMMEWADAGAIDSIQVDGHTDTNGSHDYNQDLSERRAKTVADYMIARYPEIKKYVKTAGYAYDRPIFTPDGRVDMDASRRVEFCFTLKVSE